MNWLEIVGAVSVLIFGGYMLFCTFMVTGVLLDAIRKDVDFSLK